MGIRRNTPVCGGDRGTGIAEDDLGRCTADLKAVRLAGRRSEFSCVKAVRPSAGRGDLGGRSGRGRRGRERHDEEDSDHQTTDHGSLNETPREELR